MALGHADRFWMTVSLRLTGRTKVTLAPLQGPCQGTRKPQSSPLQHLWIADPFVTCHTSPPPWSKLPTGFSLQTSQTNQIQNPHEGLAAPTMVPEGN